MKNKMLVLSFMLIAVFALSATAVSGADMFSGTWKENITKSKFNPGPPPKQPTTQKIETVDNGLKFVIDVDSSTHSEFNVKFDGKDYPYKYTVDGKPTPTASDMVSAKKIDDYTLELTFKLKGKMTGINKNVVSKDGKTRTVTRTSTDDKSKSVMDTIIFDKQ